MTASQGVFASSELRDLAPYLLASLPFLWAFYAVFLHPLAGVPGPRLAKVTRGWHTYKCFKGQWHQVILDLHEKYGPVVRIAPDEVSFVDATALKKLFGHGSNSAPKTKWYNTWQLSGQGESVFATQNAQMHAKLRRKLASTYSMTAILQVESLVQEVADENWAAFERIAGESRVIDLDFWTGAFSYDVVSELGMGGRLGFVKSATDVNGLIRAVTDGFYTITNMGHVPGQMLLFDNPITSSLLKLFGARNAFEDFIKWLDERVRCRQDGTEPAKRHDMLESFRTPKGDDEQVTHPEVMVEAINLLGAGADTTSIGIRAVLGHLLEYPESYKAVQEEIDGYFAVVGDLEAPSKLSFKECQKLPKLQNVIREAQRLHPSIVYQLPRLSPGVEIAGHFIPPGYAVSISSLSANRDKAVFGSDANSFRPSRWEDEDEAKRMDSMLCTFGAGNRSCLGKNLALVEINIYVAQLLRQYDLESAVEQGQPKWKNYSQWFNMQTDFLVRLRRRSNGST
ncbi:cytochrome P450 [Acaromyces ingoldii]|uniref:Cytochrome P450 n=1 Tax=Acaromyces ingoldii TaxID=215250 RepID=A0A316YU39_9BASI|nr:cytochrome P450 [Acaromyces ingoldii]PWN92576.1 cytochrome P450 [Acaromyces ingoldii]